MYSSIQAYKISHFSVFYSAAHVWNALPAVIEDCNSLVRSKTELKHTCTNYINFPGHGANYAASHMKLYAAPLLAVAGSFVSLGSSVGMKDIDSVSLRKRGLFPPPLSRILFSLPI